MTEATAGYAVAAADSQADAPSILSLWGKAFPGLAGEAGKRKLRMMYMENPAGAGLLSLLHSPDGEVVGVMGLGPRIYSFAGDSIRAATMSDMMVEVGHRALGPALMLLRNTTAAGRDHFDFLCAFPNERSEAVLIRAGYRKFGEMTRHGRILRAGRHLRARFGRWWGRALTPLLDAALWLSDAGRRALSGRVLEYRESGGFDASFDALWAECSVRPQLMAERSGGILAWYFLELMSSGRWLVSTARGERSGEVRGYVVWRVRNGIAQIVDFLWANERLGRALLERVVWAARRRGCTAVSLEFSGASDTVKTLRAASFHARETWPIYHAPGQETPGRTPDEWYLTTFDRDAI